jgi:excinuclease ABC subunit A
VKSADYVIDLGPEGGAQGGHVVAAGTPEEIAASAASHTGAFLREVLRPDGTGLRPALSEQRL